MFMNLPNRLTLTRLVIVPLFVAAMMVDHEIGYGCAYLLFIVASVTDYLDGKIARDRGLVTNFGKLMDPIADKVLMSAAFVMMMQVPSLRIPAWAIVAILAREFLVTGARALAVSDGAVLAANIWGKSKTVIQMVYIYVFLFFAIAGLLVQRWAEDYVDRFSQYLTWSSYGGIVFVAVFTMYSGLQFARSNWQSLNLGSRK